MAGGGSLTTGRCRTERNSGEDGSNFFSCFVQFVQLTNTADVTAGQGSVKHAMCWIESWPWNCATRLPTVTRSRRVKNPHRRGVSGAPTSVCSSRLFASGHAIIHQYYTPTRAVQQMLGYFAGVQFLDALLVRYQMRNCTVVSAVLEVSEAVLEFIPSLMNYPSGH